MIIDPERTVFALLSFEGPDVYSQAGGLGVRMKGLSRTLAQLGFQTYLYFCGDPDLPGEETEEGGRLVLRRWCQWISAKHRAGVYDGEEEKIRDWNSSLPPSLIDSVIAPAAAAGKNVVVMGEEWHTAWSMSLLADSLYYRGLRDRVVILWNANNTFGFQRISWAGLAMAHAGDLDAGVAQVRRAIAMQPGWAELLPRLGEDISPAAPAVTRALGL